MYKLFLVLSLLVASNEAQASFVVQNLYCSKANVYFESAGEPLEGQEEVMKVVLKRMTYKHRPKSACGVVLQKSQFSWTADKGKFGKKIPNKYNDVVISTIQRFPFGGDNDHYWACSGINKVKPVEIAIVDGVPLPAPWWYEGEEVTKINNHCFVYKGY